MRTRLHIDIQSVTGKELYSEMIDEDGNLYPESTIESVYISNISGCTQGKVQTIKLPSKNKRRMTDGWMTFKYTDTVRGFTGIQECKRGSAASLSKLPLQLAQAIKYYWEMCPNRQGRKFKVFCLTSEKYFSYVYKKDIEQLIDELDPLFKIDDCPPNELANKPYNHKAIIEKIKNFNVPFNTKVMPDKVDLQNILRDIYLNCLD